MTEIKNDFTKYFSKNFNLPILSQNGEKIHFEAKEQISYEVIDEIIQKFFEENGYSLKKILSGGFFFLKGKERVIVTITNLSGKYPFSIFISIS
ncbi:MAG: hypothetical protein WC849_00775 [Candidatus Paceibacterota bacterium]